MDQVSFTPVFNPLKAKTWTFTEFLQRNAFLLLLILKKSTQTNSLFNFYDDKWRYCLQKKPIKALYILKSSCKKVWNFESLRKQDTDVHKVAWFDTATVLSCTDLLHSSHLLTHTYLYNQNARITMLTTADLQIPHNFKTMLVGLESL